MLALVEPLVPRDNEQSRAARAPQWLVTAEVLTGLGVLTSRTTFSAAANLLAELERDAEPLLVGEPTGGSPNLYGDPVDVLPPETGLAAHVAGEYWELAPPDDERLAFEPDVPVELSAGDYFAGRDPVFTAALGRAPR